jgi:hypothetical protein
VSGTVRFGEIADAWETDAKFHGEHQRIGPAMELAFALDERGAGALSPLRFVFA